MNLVLLKLTGFTALRKLSLRRNRIVSLQGMEIERCVDLRVLDLRENALADFTQVVDVCNCLSQLMYVGLEGNALGANWRAAFIASLSHFRRVDHELRFIDGEEVTVSEVIANTASTFRKAEEREEFRFDLAVHRRISEELQTNREQSLQATDAIERIPLPDRDEVTKLDLGLCELSYIDLHEFPSLIYLNLSGNHLDIKAFERSNIGACTQLQTLLMGKMMVLEAAVVSVIGDRINAQAPIPSRS